MNTSDQASSTYLPAGLPAPADDEGVHAPYWQGLAAGRVMVQRCSHCGTWQFGGEWLCHHCHAWDPPWVEVAPEGRLFSWERVWHRVHPALKAVGPYLAVIVELPQAGGVRMLGNLLGDPLQAPVIGAALRGVFEPHPAGAQGQPPYTLLQWRIC